MLRSLLAYSLSLSGLVLSVQAAPKDHAARMAESQKLFAAKVRPALLEHCVRCHGGDKTKSGLNITSREGLLQGGDVGESVIPGDAKNSLLYQAVAHLDEELAMPPKKPKLPDETIAAIARWIDLGAAYDKPLLDKSGDEKAPMKVTPEDRAYWAYAPLANPAVPKIDRPELSTIDRFIHAGYRKEALVPAEALSRHKLIRRAFFDLIGLPPTPSEVAQFVDNKNPEAFAHLIDDLLSRPGYGERWGRHWLDVARFAESHGFEHDYNRNVAFHYRDFVIRALNQDMSYNQFVRWQIAGDEIAPDNSEAMAATGFLGAGVYPTQITVSEAERVRFDALDDMVATMGSAMLATTIGCARCHDHKYDPIPTRDYYELLSAFTTTVRSEIEVEAGPTDPKLMTAFEEKLKPLQEAEERYKKEQAPARLQAWLKKHRETAAPKPKSPWTVLTAEPLLSKGGAKFERQADGSYLATGANAAYDAYTFTTTAPFDDVRALRIEALAHPSMKAGGPGRAANGNIALSQLTVTSGTKDLKLANARATFSQKNNLGVGNTIDNNPKSSWAVDPQFGKNHAAVYDITNPELVKGVGRRLTIKLHFNGNTQHNIGRLRISVSQQAASSLPLLDNQSDPLDAVRKELLTLDQQSKADEKRMLELFLQLDPAFGQLRAKTTAHLSTKPQRKKEKIMVCSEGFKPMRHHTSSGRIPDFYKESFYLVRGDPAQKDGNAPLGFLKVLMRDESGNRWQAPGSAARTSQKRLAVANWITDVDHGAGHLLARVIVNRLWQHHFGRGLVDTPNDFGFQGTKPTHPELLDYLARDLIANGWTLKRLHKKIMLSRTYALGSSQNSENLKKDPKNQLWWKRDPRRLEAETIRDNALAVSGQLDRKMFGPGTLDQGMKRRSIYFMVKRSKLVPMMQLFDWPDTMTSLGRRAVTTTPSQALVFINSPEVRSMATQFAQSLEGEADPIGAAVYRAFGQPPSRKERALMVKFLDEQIRSYGEKKEPALIDFCHALLAANEMIFVE